MLEGTPATHMLPACNMHSFCYTTSVSQNKAIGKPAPSTCIFSHNKAGTERSLVMVTEDELTSIIARTIRTQHTMRCILHVCMCLYVQKLYHHVKNAHTEFCDLSMD